MKVSEYFAVHLTVFALGVGWSVIFYLAKRTLDSLHQKVEQGHESLKGLVERREGRMKGEMKELAGGMSRQLRLLRAERERETRTLKHEMEKMLSEQGKRHLNLYVSRQEFGASVATISHKVDSIYDIVKKEGIPAK